jgi:hypothetical protein
MVAPAQFAQALATDEHELDIGHTDLVTADGSSFVHRKHMLTERTGEKFLISEQFMTKNQLFFFFFFFLHVWPSSFPRSSRLSGH